MAICENELTMRKINQKQIDAVLKLGGNERYEHFIKVVVDCEEAWGLYSEGWALAADIQGRPALCLWPAKEYAQVCAQDEWNGYAPQRISLDELMDVLLPKLETDGVRPAVFPTPLGKGITPAVEELLAALNGERKRY